jgi:hypothetical protein
MERLRVANGASGCIGSGRLLPPLATPRPLYLRHVESSDRRIDIDLSGPDMHGIDVAAASNSHG